MERRSRVIAAIAGILAIIAIAEIYFFRLTLPLENRLTDQLLRITAERSSPDPSILLVDIDEKSLAVLAELVGRWPWPRSIHAELVEAASEYEPAAIVFDILFTDPDIYRPDDDAYFSEVVGFTPSVLLPMLFLEGADPSTGVEIAPLETQLGARRSASVDESARVPLLLPGAIEPEGWRLGSINYDEDPDGIGRRYEIERDTGGWFIPSLPTRVARLIGVDVPPADEILLSWKGTELPSYDRISYSDLYKGFDSLSDEELDALLKDRILIIGSTAPGLHDLRHTPIDSLHPALEIVATAVDNLMNADYLSEAGPRVTAGATAGALLVLAVLFMRIHSVLPLTLIMLLLSSAAYGASYIALQQRLVVHVFNPVVFAWVFFVCTALYSYVRERRLRGETTKIFNRFLDPQVVKELVDSGENKESLGSSRRRVTVLFSDIRGYTTLSEQYSAEEIVEVLNEYFALQVETIFKYDGTLDKFIGDAIMAFWGAPRDSEDQAENAIRAALEMASNLKAFRERIGGGFEDLEIGIGIHTGEAVVGFLGSEQRQDYTVIGDTVNLASRIEGLTKDLGCRIVASSDTCKACGDMFDFAPKGSHHVKGRAQAVELFSPSTRHESE